MKQFAVALMAILLVSVLFSTVQARNGPHQQAIAVEQIPLPAAPVVSSVPPLTPGFDVIQNLEESKNLFQSVTTERWRQSTTVDRDGFRVWPAVVLLA